MHDVLSDKDKIVSTQQLRLDLGAGKESPPGFVSIGQAHGSPIYPLPWPDECAEEIRASHCLEHFGHQEVSKVLKEWMRVLKPGGTIKIAVPDFKKTAEDYLAGKPQPTEGYVMGGQTDLYDYHKAIFDEAHLKQLMHEAGALLLKPWKSELQDCASLPISLNIMGRKPKIKDMSISAVMSCPRLGFTEHSSNSIDTLPRLNVKLRHTFGAFWGPSMQRGMEQVLEEDKPDAILTLDYDTIFRVQEASRLIALAMVYPEYDAIAPMQAGRGPRATPLFQLPGEFNRTPDGSHQLVPAETFIPDIADCKTAHFGLTLIRSSAFEKLKKPWFHSEPDEHGGWGDGRVDDDIFFWREFKRAGLRLGLANHVVVGHLELMVKWPSKDALQATYQTLTDWRQGGPPKDVWE